MIRPDGLSSKTVPSSTPTLREGKASTSKRESHGGLRAVCKTANPRMNVKTRRMKRDRAQAQRPVRMF